MIRSSLHHRPFQLAALCMTAILSSLSVAYSEALAFEWSPEERLTFATSASDLSALVSDASGHLHMVWEDGRDGNREVYYKEWDGAAWSPDTRLTNSPGHSLWPSVAVASAESLYVCWYDLRDGNAEIYFKRRVAGVWLPDERLTNDPAVSYRPSMAADSSGAAHVVWYDRRDGNYEIYYKKLGASGWSADERLTDDPASSVEPAIAAGLSNSLHVVWSDDRDGNLELYSMSWDGSQWSSSLRLTNASGVSQYPAVSADPLGGIHVFWLDARSSSAQVFYKRFESGSWSGDLQISNSPYWTYQATGIADSLGRAHVVWADQRDGNFEIYYKEWDGAAWSADERLTDEPSGSLMPAVAVDPQNTVYVVWSDSRDGGGNSELYYRKRGTSTGQLTLSVADASVLEGNAGAVDAGFVVTLSSASTDTIKVSFQTADATATAAGNDYVPASGQIIFDPGVTADTVSVAVNGDIFFEPSESFFLNLSAPVNAALFDSIGAGTITNDDTLPWISIAGASVLEGNAGTATAGLVVTLSSASADTVKVDFQTADGTALTADNDYVAASGQIIFDPGATADTLGVTVNGDLTVEGDETFLVNLSAPVNAALSDSAGAVTISNDEAAPGLMIDDVAVAEGDSGTVNAVFTVSLSAPSGDTVRVLIATANGTAAAGPDYAAIAPPDTIVFPPLSVSQPVTVVVNGDVLDEDEETYTLVLSDAVNAAIVDTTGIGTITDDDAEPTISINDLSVVEGDSGTVDAIFTVTLSAASGRTISVNYSTTNGTAVADTDYLAIATPQPLIFAPGDSLTREIPVHVQGDTDFETDETFVVNLTDPVNATIVDAQGHGTIQNDDELVAVETPAPTRTFLGVMHPNPFSGMATIPYGLKNPGAVRIRLFDIRGRLVRSLLDGFEAQGYRRAIWDGRDNSGARAASGVYIVRLEAGGQTFTQSLRLLR
jgi:hypothetical protein